MHFPALVNITQACDSPLSFCYQLLFFNLNYHVYRHVLVYVGTLARITDTDTQLFLNTFRFHQTKPSCLVNRDNITQRHLAFSFFKRYTYFREKTLSVVPLVSVHSWFRLPNPDGFFYPTRTPVRLFIHHFRSLPVYHTVAYVRMVGYG